jgi:hypothetical protein
MCNGEMEHTYIIPLLDMIGTQTATKIQDKEKLATMVGRPDTKLLDLQDYFTNPSKLEKRHFAPHSKRDKGIHHPGKQEFHVSNRRPKWKKSHGKQNRKKNIHICLSQLWLTNLLQIWIPTNVHKDRRRRRGFCFKSSSEIRRMELKKINKERIHTHTHTHIQGILSEIIYPQNHLPKKKIPTQLL